MSAKAFQRKDLKHDEFIMGAGRATHWLMERRRRIGWILLAGALLVSVVLSVQFARQRQEQRAASLLAGAMDVYRAPVIPPPPDPVVTPVAGDAETASQAGTDGDSATEAAPEVPSEPAPPAPQVTGLQFASEGEKYRAAIARFEPIVERYGGRPSGRLAAFYLGICQSELGNSDAAIVALTQAADAAQPLISAIALYRLGQLELGLGNADAAVQHFELLLQLDAGFFPREEALMATARAYRDAGDPRAALAAYQRVLQDFVGSYAEIEARAQVEELSAQLGLDPDIQGD